MGIVKNRRSRKMTEVENGLAGREMVQSCLALAGKCGGLSVG